MDPDKVRCDDAADGARLGLLGVMTGISEDHWSAGWLIDLELVLWRACEDGGPFEYGHGIVTQRQCALLRLLSEEAEGWWVFDIGAGPVFLPMDKWLARVASRRNDR
jgi:hypothetical protein